MDINPPELPFLSTIGFMLTYKCTIACPHCLIEGGPHRKEEMSLEHSLAWIKQARAYRDGHIKGLALTGGEPFYNLENLARISTFGRALGFMVTVVTNAFWASTKEKALGLLGELPAIQIIAMSTDVYHQKFIPFDYIKNALWAAKKLKRLYNIAVCTDSREDLQFQKIMAELEGIGEAENTRVALTFPVGRAKKRARYFSYDTDAEPTVAACSMASTPVVFPDGKVKACIGPVLTLPAMHPMVLGDLQQNSMSEILDRSELNPVLHTIRVWGPHKLVALLKQNGLESLLPREYISNCICDVCYKLLADERIVAALGNILEDEEIGQNLAFARMYYLNETTMAELYHLDEPGSQNRQSLEG